MSSTAAEVTKRLQDEALNAPNMLFCQHFKSKHSENQCQVNRDRGQLDPRGPYGFCAEKCQVGKPGKRRKGRPPKVQLHDNYGMPYQTKEVVAMRKTRAVQIAEGAIPAPAPRPEPNCPKHDEPYTDPYRQHLGCRECARERGRKGALASNILGKGKTKAMQDPFVVDLALVPGLREALEKAAQENLRTPEQQLMFWVRNCGK